MRIGSSIAVTALDGLVDSVDAGASAGYIEFRTGSAPATCEAADTGTVAATCTLNDPAFGSAADDTGNSRAMVALDVSPEPTDSSATGGTAAHFRIKDSNNVVRFQGTVGTSGADINFDNNVFAAGAEVRVTGLTLYLPHQ